VQTTAASSLRVIDTQPGAQRSANPSRLRRQHLYAAVGVILCCLAVALLPFGPKKYGDLEFHSEAKNVALALKGVNTEPVTIIRAPGPVLFYAIPYLFMPAGAPDNSYWNAAVVWTILCMTISLFCIQGAVRRLYGNVAEGVAIVLALLTPFWAYYSFGVNGEGAAFLGDALFLYGWARWRTASRWRALDLLAAWLGLVLFLLTKPSAIGLAGLAIVAAIVMWRGKDRRQAIFAISCAVVMGCTSLASSVALKHFERPDYRPAQLLYFRWTAFLGSRQMRSEPWDWRFWDDTTRAGSRDYADFVHDLATVREEAVRTRYSVFDLEWRWVLNDFEHHPLVRAKMALVRALFMHVNLVNSVDPDRFHLGPLKGRAAYIAFHVAINLFYFVLVGSSLFFLFTRRSDLFTYWLLWGPWLALLAFHAVVYAEARYLFPVQPGLLVMASAMLAPRLQRLWPGLAC